MPYSTLWKAAGVITAFAAIIVAGMVNNSRHVRAHDDDNERDDARIQRGFDIAPFDLNVDEKDRKLVGLGSYLVNAVGDCNGCHSAGPATEFAMGGNPYFLSPPFTGNRKDKYGDLFRRRAGFWPDRLSSAPLLPQFDAGQNGAACRWAHLRAVRR